jgi:hypothetical protein
MADLIVGFSSEARSVVVTLPAWPAAQFKPVRGSPELSIDRLAPYVVSVLVATRCATVTYHPLYPLPALPCVPALPALPPCPRCPSFTRSRVHSLARSRLPSLYPFFRQWPVGRTRVLGDAALGDRPLGRRERRGSDLSWRRRRDRAAHRLRTGRCRLGHVCRALAPSHGVFHGAVDTLLPPREPDLAPPARHLVILEEGVSGAARGLMIASDLNILSAICSIPY